MPDIVAPEVRSRMMAGIRGRDTRPELMIRRGLHALGFRYRLHDRRLPGRPDLVFPKYRAALFVNGCFWHGHDCPLFRMPGTRQEFWSQKIESNRMRDRRARAALAESGWRSLAVWECAFRGTLRTTPEAVIQEAAAWLVSGDGEADIRGTGDGGG